MSEVRLVVREAERDWSGTIHGSCADCAVAALSADPVTLVELEADRFIDSLESVASAEPDLADRCHDLTSDLRQLLDPSPPEPTREAYDDEIPF